MFGFLGLWLKFRFGGSGFSDFNRNVGLGALDFEILVEILIGAMFCFFLFFMLVEV